MRILSLKKLVVFPVIFLLCGCYSYQSVSTGAKLAQENYEGPIFIPHYFPETYPPFCILTGIVTVTKINESEQPQRTEQTIAIRNGGEGRILDNRERRK